MEAKVSWRKPEQIYFCWRIYAILATLWTNEGAKTPPILCACVRNRDQQWWQAAETHMPPPLHLSNIASFLKFPSTTSMASWQKAHQFCSSYTLAEQLLSNRLITERVKTYGSPPQSKSQTRFAPNLPLNLLLCYYFKTRTPAWDSLIVPLTGDLFERRAVHEFFDIYAHFTSSWSPSRRILNRDPFGADSWTLGL